MNIWQAKEQIEFAMRAYFSKDEYGRYCLPSARQRPMFLMGPPGVGKTAIMAQIASELNVALLSYSMTHHTRQSALGLPFIVQKTYGEREYSVSEYTMSEIIASVYDLMEETGKREGILFLDEMNCVSETLLPVMLQFLQYKVFGRHRVPEGWIIVAAGNPPEYNDSVRDFDMAIWDRVRRIDVEPDFSVWRKYAAETGMHPSVLAYLDGHREHLYSVRATVEGKQFVTMRGWSDLSDVMLLYDGQGLRIDEVLIGQFVQDEQIAKDFAVYYDLFKKYRGDYQIAKIMDGIADEKMIVRAKNAPFDERLAVIALLMEEASVRCQRVMLLALALDRLLGEAVSLGDMLRRAPSDIVGSIDGMIAQKREALYREKLAGALSRREETITEGVIALYGKLRAAVQKKGISDAAGAIVAVQKICVAEKKEISAEAAAVGQALANAFAFLEAAFGEGQEILLFVTELTENFWTSQYIAKFGCEKYLQYNKDLMFFERQVQLAQEIGND